MECAIVKIRVQQVGIREITGLEEALVVFLFGRMLTEIDSCDGALFCHGTFYT